MVNCHTVLYGLIIGILDDLLANTKIQILSDEILIDIVPTSTQPTKPQNQGNISREDNSSSSISSREFSSPKIAPNSSFAFASFAAGLGMGMAVMALVSSSAR